jgi:drug/metabolite transporter (DMT)-like permease
VLGLALALSSSLCWGVADFIGGVQARRVPLLRVMLVSQGAGLACVVALLAARGVGPPHLTRLLPAAAAGIAGIAALTAFYRALSIGTMSIVAPISATGVAVPVIVGVAGGDRPALLQVLGILTAVVGVVLASREQDAGLHQRQIARASIGLALVAALGFGSFFVGIRASARADVLWTLLAARSAGVLALLVVAAVRGGLRGPGGRPLLALVTMGLLDLGANGLYAIASRHGLLSVVAVAASLYPLATVVLARALLGEQVRRVQELGIGAALLGIVMIAAG